MKKLAPIDIFILEAQSNDTLAKWWCLLNAYEWPAEMPDEPTPELRRELNNRGSIIMEWIMCKIRFEACLEVWNAPKTDQVAFWKKYAFVDTSCSTF